MHDLNFYTYFTFSKYILWHENNHINSYHCNPHFWNHNPFCYTR